MTLAPSDLNVTDAHAHFFSHTFFRTLLSMRPGKGRVGDDEVAPAIDRLEGPEPPPRDPLVLAQRWVAELDRHGVRQMALIASVPNDWPSVAAAVRAHPDRFIGLTMANPLAEKTEDMLEEAFTEGGIRGVCLFPAMNRFYVYDPPARRLIDLARKHGALVFCHFGLLSVPIRDRLGVPNTFDGTYGVPTDLHRLAADYPDVTFQIPHFGCGYFRETLFLAAQRPNVVVDTSSSNGWLKLLPYPLDLEAVVRKTLEVFGPQRILWGSDSSVFPRGWRRDLFDLQVEIFEKAGTTEEDLHAIFGGNARRVLGV